MAGEPAVASQRFCARCPRSSSRAAASGSPACSPPSSFTRRGATRDLPTWCACSDSTSAVTPTIPRCRPAWDGPRRSSPGCCRKIATGRHTSSSSSRCPSSQTVESCACATPRSSRSPLYDEATAQRDLVCAAAEIYLQIATEECSPGAARCFPAQAAERAFERCSGGERAFTHHRGIVPTPIPPGTQRLYRVRRCLLERSTGDAELRASILRRWATEYASQWGDLDTAISLYRELLEKSPTARTAGDAGKELSELEHERANPQAHSHCY
jgi:hypothetical protein